MNGLLQGNHFLYCSELAFLRHDSVICDECPCQHFKEKYIFKCIHCLYPRGLLETTSLIEGGIPSIDVYN